MNTELILPKSPSNNRNVETPKLERAAFAAGIARHEFGGRNYRGEDHDGFIDRQPGELALARAIRWRHGSDIGNHPTSLTGKRARLFSADRL